MRDLFLGFKRQKTHNVKGLTELFRKAIKSKRVEGGDPLPSLRELADECGVHRNTVLTVYQELEAEGYVISKPRQGYFVNPMLPDSFFEIEKAKTKKLQRVDFQFKQIELPELELFLDSKYIFSSGLPDLDQLPLQDIKSCFYDSLKVNREKILGYCPAEGHPPLINELKLFLKRMRSIQNQQTVITNGCQEAVSLVAALMISRGDYVFVEELGFPPIHEMFKFHGAELVPMKIDLEGVCIDGLEEKIKHYRPKIMYLTPHHQYPTTVILKADRRKRIYDLCVKYKIMIIEDDYDHEFHYEGIPVAPMAANDPYGIICYCSTFSKVLFPSARLGFVTTHNVDLYSQLVNLKRITTRQNETLTQDILARWMRSGGLHRHMRRMKRTYERRRDLLVSLLNETNNKIKSPLNFEVPIGGMAVWIDLGRDSELFCRKLLNNGVAIRPESFFLTGAGKRRGIRMGFANESDEKIREGYKIFESLLLAK